MNRKFILFAILLIYQYLLITTLDECSSNFESYKYSRCTAITLNSTHQCLYSNNKCYTFYKTCSSYKAEEGKKIDSKICSSISASADDRICKVDEKKNQCIEVNRECEDYNGKTDCEDLEAGTNQRCVLFNGKCEAHYTRCNYITEEGKCGKNIPDPNQYSTNRYSKCFWDTKTNPSNPSCEATDRTCSEYNTYKDFIGCKDLKPTDTNKKCIYDSDKCYEGYGDCSNYNGEDRTTCQKYKHIDSNNILDHLYKCDLNEQKKCVSILKECSDFIKGEDEDYCKSFSTKDITKTKCVLEDKQCKEKYISCSAYNSVDEEKRDKDECEKIKPFKSGTNIDPHLKCEMVSNECTQKNKDCSEITDEVTCKGHSLLDKPLKVCVFKDNKCIEQYSSCSDYNSNVEKKNEKECTSIEDPTGKCVFIDNQCIVQVIYTSCSSYNDNVADDKKNEKDCTSIIESPYSLKCVFTPRNGNTPAKCESKTFECSDYNFDSLKDLCTNYLDSNTQKCTYKNGSCTKTAKKCKDVVINILETEKSNEGICNSAPTEGSNKICTLNKDKNGCIEQDKPKQAESSSPLEDNNSGNDKYLNKILIFILFLLL